MEELEAELKIFFEDIDVQEEYGLSLDEALELVLDGQDIYLWKDRLEDYVFSVQLRFESASHYNVGKSSGFTNSQIEELKNILALSPYIKMEVTKIDLRNAEYIMLSDGSKIPINKRYSK